MITMCQTQLYILLLFLLLLCQTSAATGPQTMKSLTIPVRNSNFQLEYVIPEDTFFDSDHGNARNLKLYLNQEDGTDLSKDSWVYLADQTVKLYSSKSIVEGQPSGGYKFSLKAVDPDSQTNQTSLTILFGGPVLQPNYLRTLKLSTTNSVIIAYKDVEIIFHVKSKIAAYLSMSDHDIYNAVITIQRTGTSSLTLIYAFSTRPLTGDTCNASSIMLLRDKLDGATAEENIRQILLPQYTFISISNGKYENHCSKLSSKGQPVILNPLTKTVGTLNISVCGLFAFEIPADTFYDNEDGDTRRLSLVLNDENNQSLSNSNWLHLNGSTQTIKAFATVNFAATQPSNGYKFILLAKDSSGLSASTTFITKIDDGAAQILKDCQIQVSFKSAAPVTNNDNFSLIQKVVKGLKNYFSISNSEIGLLDFHRDSSTTFTLSWSYCSPAYKSLTKATKLQESHVDYHGFVTKILMLLYNSDRKTVKSSFMSAFQDLSVVSVKAPFSGFCANIPPILVSISSLIYSVDYCGYRDEKLQAGWFYDHEDGDTFNLTLDLLNSAHERVGIENWVNIDLISRNLLISLRDTQRQSGNYNFVFYLKATDSGGKSAALSISLRLSPQTHSRSPFNITFEYLVSPNVNANPYVNESVLLSEITSKLYSLTSGRNIITTGYAAKSAQIRSFTWLSCSYQSCSTSSVLQTTKQLFDRTKPTLKSFKEAYLPAFQFKRAYYSSSCSSSGMPPAVSESALELNVTMCAPLIYKIPSTTFIDSGDGETQNMKIRLLDNSRNPISPESWIQLNTATLELFAIYQSIDLPYVNPTTLSTTKTLTSVPASKAFSFNLEATNSQGMTSYKQFRVNILDYPYTSDCYTTISIRRRFGGAEISNLDVLYRLVNAISKFFSDQRNSIKVHRFRKTSESLYSLVFSNCSFVFPTMKEAKWGLNELHRPAISAIFSKMIKADGIPTDSFKASLSNSGFNLESINASYNCIEEPPYTKVTTLRPYAFLCREYNDPLAEDLFYDARDGGNLSLSLRYKNGLIVSPDEWVQLDPIKKIIYGSVTYMVKRNIPAFEGYKYHLYAMDSSGRTAKILYNIKVANAPPLQYVRFVLGFQSVFTVYSKTADIFLNVTRKIAKYLNNKDAASDVIIYSYDPINLVTFELCQFQCTPTVMGSTLQKLQRDIYKPLPSDSFKAAMGASIIPRYIYVNGPKCIESTTVTIVVNYVITTNQPMCGFLEYKIPQDVFSNSLGETTRDFLLTLYTSKGEEVGYSSIIHFHQDLQTIHGVAIYSKISSYLMYNITASSSRSTATATSTLVKLNFPDYSKYSQSESSMCTMTAKVVTSLNPALPDVFILRTFMNKVANFFKSDVQLIQIVSYTRNLTYPIGLTIKFANCTWLSLLHSSSTMETYYEYVQTTLLSIFQYSGSTIVGVSSGFKAALQPDFEITSLVINSTTCLPSKDKPPKANELRPIHAAPCGEFNYKIPADLFNDEDGNTRNLTLEILQENGAPLTVDSWIVFESNTQTISGLPLNRTLVQQPEGGYKYKMKAVDRLGQASFASLTIIIDGEPYAAYDDLSLNLFYQSTIKSRYEMDTILAFTRKISKYIGDSKNQFRIISSTVSLVGIAMTLVNCTRCNSMAIIKYVVLYLTKPAFDVYMLPEFPFDYRFRIEGQCSEGDEWNNVTSGVTHNITFCKRSQFDFLKLYGVSRNPESLRIIVRDALKKQLPLSSWFWFNESSFMLHAFPSVAVLETQPAFGTFYTWATVSSSTGERTGAFQKNALRIVGSPPPSSLQYNVTFSSTLSSNLVDAYFVTRVFDSLSLYLNRKDLQFVSMSRLQSNPFKFEMKFQICGLPNNCSEASVLPIHNKIFESNEKLRAEFKSIFSGELNVLAINDNCPHKPPEILTPYLYISIPICGMFRFRIPSNIAKDRADGSVDQLLFSMRMSDNSMVPRDSWIRFNETSNEIYALAPESIARAHANSRWFFRLLVKNKAGRQAEIPLTVFVERDAPVYYKHSMSFMTVNTDVNVPFLDIQVKFLRLISEYLPDSSLPKYRLLSFTKTITNGPNSETFYIQFGDCSVSETLCKENAEQLKNLHSDMYSSNLNTNSKFSKYMSSNFVIKSTRNDSLYKIDQSPILINKIDTVQVDACGMYVADIPFYDVEQGKDLSILLTYENGSKSDIDFWIQLINRKLYVVPIGSVQSGTYVMRLTASDKCGHKVSTKFQVNLKDSGSPSQYVIEMKFVANRSVPLAYYASKIKDALKTYFSDSRYFTRIFYYNRHDSNAILRWSNCTFICENVAINTMKRRLFVAYDNMNPEFSSLFDFDVTNVTDIRYGNCTKQQSNPPVANKSISIEVSLCTKLNFTVPLDTFFDLEDGNTRNLRLSLLTESLRAVGLQDWVQIDQKNQILYGYPRFDGNFNFQRIFNYRLAATDKEWNSVSTPLTIKITGNIPVVSYKLTMSGTTTLSSSIPLVSQEIRLINGIGEYFKDPAINDIAYIRNGKEYVFTWSFCSMRTESCDCYQIQKIRKMLPSIKLMEQFVGNHFIVNGHVSEQFHGVCANRHKPELRHERTEMTLETGKYFSYVIRDDKFYDLEDGYTRNLTLYVSDSDNVRLPDSHWMKLQNNKICGLLTFDEAQRAGIISTSSSGTGSASSKIYKMFARDSCGDATADSFIVRMNTMAPSPAYRIAVFLKESFGKNCTRINTFISKISSYISYTSSDIIIVNYTIYNQTSYSSVVVWGLRNITEKDCSNDTIKTIRERFIYVNGSVNLTFYEHMKPQFEVIYVRDNTSSACSIPAIIIPPASSDGSFPWWIIILVLALILLLLLCWLCWLCIPRCCPNWWQRCCGGCCAKCCGKCCLKGGKSFEDEEAVAGLPKTPDENITEGKENEGEEDETLLIPPPYLVPDDPSGRNFGFERDGPDEDGDSGDIPIEDGDSPNGNEGKTDEISGDDSSGIQEDVGGKEDYSAKADRLDSGVIEQEIQLEEVQMAETAPGNSTFYDAPPLYSFTSKERRSRDDEEDFFADVLAEARRASEDSGVFHQSQGFENSSQSSDLAGGKEAYSKNILNSDVYEGKEALGESQFQNNSESNEARYESLYQSEASERKRRSGMQSSTNEAEHNENMISEDRMSEENFRRGEFETNYETRINGRSMQVVDERRQSGDREGFFSEENINSAEKRKLPNIPHTGEQQWQTKDDLSTRESYTSHKEVMRRSSRSLNNLSEYENSMEMADQLILPTLGLRRVSLTRSVELTLPRSTFEALQDQPGYSGRRKSIPVIIDNPYGQELKEVRITGVESMDSSSYRQTESSFSKEGMINEEERNILPAAPFSAGFSTHERSIGLSNIIEPQGRHFFSDGPSSGFTRRKEIQEMKSQATNSSSGSFSRPEIQKNVNSQSSRGGWVTKNRFVDDRSTEDIERRSDEGYFDSYSEDAGGRSISNGNVRRGMIQSTRNASKDDFGRSYQNSQSGFQMQSRTVTKTVIKNPYEDDSYL